MEIGVGRDIIVFAQDRHEFIDDDAGVFVSGRIIFVRSIGSAVAPLAGVGFGLVGAAAGTDEDGQHHGDLAAIDQVVEDVLRLHGAGLLMHGGSVIKDHEGGGDGRVVLRGEVNEIGVGGAGKDLAGQDVGADPATFRNAGHGFGIRTERVKDIVGVGRAGAAHSGRGVVGDDAGRGGRGWLGAQPRDGQEKGGQKEQSGDPPP